MRIATQMKHAMAALAASLALTARAVALLLAGLLLAAQAGASEICGSVGSFATTLPCCQGLVKDQNSRCQYPTCKKAGDPAIVNTSNGTADCCYGLVPVSGVCREPTLRKICALVGTYPTSTLPCCTGLVKSTSTAMCVRNTVTYCSVTQIPTCCNGPLVTKNICACYCSSPYYLSW